MNRHQPGSVASRTCHAALFFAEGVAELQPGDVFVMPYINGRLWDTHDRAADVFQFYDVALSGATKDETGKPYTETYGSKENDGSHVELAVLCPTTRVWKSKVREIVLGLMKECGVTGVYIDQVAVAKPKLCFDASFQSLRARIDPHHARS